MLKKYKEMLLCAVFLVAFPVLAWGAGYTGSENEVDAPHRVVLLQHQESLNEYKNYAAELKLFADKAVSPKNIMGGQEPFNKASKTLKESMDGTYTYLKSYVETLGDKRAKDIGFLELLKDFSDLRIEVLEISLAFNRALQAYLQSIMALAP